jgi:hypothetical protein
MAKRKAAIINISKGLLNVSLATLAAVGGATGNPFIAGAAAIPQALASSGILKTLLEKKQEELLELPVPPWWTDEPQSQSWQAVCSSIENRLPKIIEGVEESIRKETSYPSSSDIKRIFAESVAQQLSPWEVKPQDRGLVAGYVTPPLLEKSAAVLKAAIDSTREEALAKLLAKIADTFEDARKSTAPTSSTALPGTVVQNNIPAASIVGTSQSLQSIAITLEKKRQNGAYDVYICYDEADEVDAMDIGEKLKARGILPWFDMLEVKPGTPEKRRQEQQIQRIPAAAMFVGQHKIVDKQELQMYTFIDQFFEREIPVIPVILASSPKDLKLPPYLGNFGRVDFRRSTPEPMGQLIWGITGERPSA